MCGITGFVEHHGPASPALLERLMASMRQRGPDGEGHYIEAGIALGMRRLSILDLERGQQPFRTPDGQVIAFLNGEIYNFRELRRRLERSGARFATQCDAEILPHAFRRWGAEGMAQRFDGMFAIAIYDRADKSLHLLRDRYGEKPLFYLDQPGRFAFASQLTSLALFPDLSLEVDLAALRQYLAFHYVAGPRTILQQIRRVPAGHGLKLDLRERRPPVLRRWAEPFRRPMATMLRYDDAVEQVRETFVRAVESRLVSDVPLGVFLSGGLDSSAIAWVVAQRATRPNSFSIGFEDAELDESPFAQEAADHLGIEHHHFEFGLSACLDVFDEAIGALDEPLGDPACLPTYLLSRESRRHVKVVLSGEGGDEIFAGYGYYPRPPFGSDRSWRSRTGARFSAWLSGRTPQTGLPLLREDNTSASGFPLLTTAQEREQLMTGSAADEDDWMWQLGSQLARESCPLRRAQRCDLATWLCDDLLVKFDRMTMASSLEGRAPYLEPKLAELGLGLPAQWKMGRLGEKHILREAVGAFLPERIRGRRKQGFVLPMKKWLAGPLRERVLDSLANERDDGLNAGALRGLAQDDLDRGATRDRLLYAVLAYREWFEAVRERRTLAHRLATAGSPGVARSEERS